ncbi:unnamed protein product [Amoebophrya sp. A25]|nr:unnamed protein product [Amoebophrya sp. A25]|eukprot:GSA25T00012013001.1
MASLFGCPLDSAAPRSADARATSEGLKSLRDAWNSARLAVKQTENEAAATASLYWHLQKQLANPLFLKDGGRIIFPCQKSYADSGIVSRAKLQRETSTGGAVTFRIISPESLVASSGCLLAPCGALFGAQQQLSSSSSSSSAAPWQPMLNPVRIPPKKAEKFLDAAQVAALTSVDAVVAQAAVKAGLRLKLRVMMLDDNDNPFRDDDPSTFGTPTSSSGSLTLSDDSETSDDFGKKPKHRVLSYFFPKLPENIAMTRGAFKCIRTCREIMHARSFNADECNPSCTTSSDRWVASWDDGAADVLKTGVFQKDPDRIVTVRRPKTKTAVIGYSPNGTAIECNVVDSSEEVSFEEVTEESGAAKGKDKREYGQLVFRTALVLRIPKPAKRSSLPVSSKGPPMPVVEEESDAEPTPTSGKKRAMKSKGKPTKAMKSKKMVKKS